MILFLLTIFLSCTASLAAKFLADTFLHNRIALLGDFAGLQYSHNPGIAFGLRLPAGVQEIVIVAALVFVCMLARKSARSHISRTGFGLIVGGALGNVIDRVPDGVVTDFFQIGTFPIFNVADSCITVGVAFLLAESIVSSLNKR